MVMSAPAAGDCLQGAGTGWQRALRRLAAGRRRCGMAATTTVKACGEETWDCGDQVRARTSKIETISRQLAFLGRLEKSRFLATNERLLRGTKKVGPV